MVKEPRDEARIDDVPVVPGEEGMSRQEDEPGGTDVPGVDVGQADATPAEDAE